MKKILLATSILAGTVGFASAEVTVSGTARMGVVYDGALANNETSFTSRARVEFALSGESDSGLSFGASFRADNAVGANAGTAGSVFVSGAFGRLSMGDVDGAAELATGDLEAVGLTGLGDFNEMTYLSNGSDGVRPTARFEYSAGGFTVAVSHTNPGAAGKVAALGASYSANGFSFGAGVERQEATAAVAAVAGLCAQDSGPGLFFFDNIVPTVNGSCAAGQVQLSGAPGAAAVGALTHYTLSAGYTMGAVAVKASYGNLEVKNVAGNLEQYGLSAAYTMDAVSLTAFARRDFAADQHIGIGAAYDLGGGARLVAGLVNTNFDAAGADNRTQADLGLSFAF